MKRLSFLFTLSAIFFVTGISGQCANWDEAGNKDEILQWHSIYRQEIKIKNFEMAFEHWEKAYIAAPAADGKRDYHFTDGIKLYKEKLKSASEDAKKEIVEKILTLYDEAISCYEAKTIKMKCVTDECYKEKVGYLLGRKGYDMFYELNSPYSSNFKILNKSVEKSGNKTEYIVFAPLANIAVYQFENEKIDKLQARNIHQKLNAIADHNIANNQRFSSYYQQAKDAMNASFSKIERDIFDCDYFKVKLRPEYDADPDNPEVIKKVLAILKGQGCEPGDPLYDELDAKWKKYASKENARIQAEDELNNPAKYAKRLRQEGKFGESMEKYKEAITLEQDNIKLASYYHSIAQIEYGEYKRYESARANARKAANLRPGWGKPYITIGDMYARTSRSCGDSWNQRLAVLAAIDKYNYAKSIDPEAAETASERISKYWNSLPSSDEGFMRGVKEGQTLKVGCWIGESVKVRYN